jgi:hypothetical protein
VITASAVARTHAHGPVGRCANGGVNPRVIRKELVSVHTSVVSRPFARSAHNRPRSYSEHSKIVRVDDVRLKTVDDRTICKLHSQRPGSSHRHERSPIALSQNEVVQRSTGASMVVRRSYNSSVFVAAGLPSASGCQPQPPRKQVDLFGSRTDRAAGVVGFSCELLPAVRSSRLCAPSLPARGKRPSRGRGKPAVISGATAHQVALHSQPGTHLDQLPLAFPSFHLVRPGPVSDPGVLHPSPLGGGSRLLLDP